MDIQLGADTADTIGERLSAAADAVAGMVWSKGLRLGRRDGLGLGFGLAARASSLRVDEWGCDHRFCDPCSKRLFFITRSSIFDSGVGLGRVKVE